MYCDYIAVYPLSKFALIIIFIHLVVGCSPGWWGQDCRTPCSGCSTCDQNTGICPGEGLHIFQWKSVTHLAKDY